MPAYSALPCPPKIKYGMQWKGGGAWRSVFRPKTQIGNLHKCVHYTPGKQSMKEGSQNRHTTAADSLREEITNAMSFWELTSTRYIVFELYHRLDMKLDLQSLFGLHVHSRTHWMRPSNPPPHLGIHRIYKSAIGQPVSKIDDISM